MFEQFPYTDMHQLNLDWIVKIAKDFLEQYTTIQNTITQGLEDLDNKAETLENLLQAWYDTHSQDIANQLADALQDMSEALATEIASFNAAADAKAAQTIASIPADYTILSNDVAKSLKMLGVIASGQDFNDYTNIGLFIITYSNAQNIDHIPIKEGGILQVLKGDASYTSTIQVYFDTNGGFHYRVKTSSGWGEWQGSPTYVKMEGFPSSGDLNNFTKPGMYSITYSNAQNIDSMPEKDGGNLLVIKGTEELQYAGQIYITSNGDLYYRVRTTSGWGAWAKSIRNNNIPDTGINAQILNTSIKSVLTKGLAKYSTLPKENGEIGVTEYYDSNETVNGVVYSSAWREGNDVYWNKTLETYFSALGNPASILYTDNITDLGIYNAHCVWGGVCSSLVSAMLNFPHFIESDTIYNTFDNKIMPSIKYIEVGDILSKPGHCAFISQVFHNENGEATAVEVTEQVPPTVQRRKVLINNLENYINTNGYTIKINPYGKPKYFTDADYATDIIYEFGNNTYVDSNETDHMWFYIPTETTVHIKKNTGNFVSYDISNKPTQTINGVTVYDLATLFSGVGEYILTTNTSNSKKCKLKLINTGSYNIANGVLTLSNYSGCTPKQLYIAGLYEGDDNKALDPPEGYVAWIQDSSYQEIDSDTITLAHIPSTGKYKVCIDYETGLGYKRIVTAAVGF